MANQLSFPTPQENKRLQILIAQRLEHINKQLELFQFKYPRSSASDLITDTYLQERKELLSIKEKLIGGKNENEIL